MPNGNCVVRSKARLSGSMLATVICTSQSFPSALVRADILCPGLAGPAGSIDHVHVSGGWPSLVTLERIWVPHPCGLCKGGVFDFAFPFRRVAASTHPVSFRVNVPGAPGSAFLPGGFGFLPKSRTANRGAFSGSAEGAQAAGEFGGSPFLDRYEHLSGNPTYGEIPYSGTRSEMPQFLQCPGWIFL
jgi:hypothetical protein